MGLLDDISKLTTPATELPDLEDDLDGSSLVKPSSNRSKKAQNFNFEEGKYAGAAVSRKEIFGDVSEISGILGKEEDSEDDDLEDEEDVDDEDVEEESDVEMVDVPKRKSKILESLEDSEDDEEDMKDEEEEGVEDSEDDGEDEEEEEDSEDVEDEEEESNLKMTTLSLKDDEDKADKATSVLHQRQVWDDLLYSNIRMHALLNAMNQMPRGEMRKNLLKNLDSTTQKSLETAMENMAKLRDLMKKAGGFFAEKGSGKGAESDDDEEIPSDDEEILSDSEGVDDEEDSGEEDDEIQKNQNSAKNQQGTSLKALKANLETLDTSMDKFRSTTITKWYNRTKILNSKSMNNTDFSVFEKGTILGQINKTLADEEKLLKKVHTNRSGKTRLGAPKNDSTDPEIFDDSDFYQLLLKQMLDSRNQMSQSTDGADMTRSYMELQSMISSKKKRDVSQLSSKDRKLKYEPIAKLINFYPSKPSVATWSHESRNELFKSLFS